MARCLPVTYTVRYRIQKDLSRVELTPAPLQVLEAGYRCRLHHSGDHIPSARDIFRGFQHARRDTGIVLLSAFAGAALVILFVVCMLASLETAKYFLPTHFGFSATLLPASSALPFMSSSDSHCL